MNELTRCEGRTISGRQCRKLVSLPLRRCGHHAKACSTPASYQRDAFVRQTFAVLERDLGHVPSTGHPVSEGSGITGSEGRTMADITGSRDWSSWMIDGLVAEGAELGAELGELIAEGDHVMEHSLAATTVDGYQRKFAAFERWCASVGACSLPAQPQTVAAYVLRLARLGTTRSDVTYDAAATGDAGADTTDGDAAGRLQSSTIAGTVAAIGSVHRNNGYFEDRDPSRHPRVRKLIGAYARTYLRNTTQAHAFTLEELGLMCDRCLLPSNSRARDMLLICVATHPNIDVNGLQLGRLGWDMVGLPDPDDTTMAARFEFGGRVGTVWVPPEPDDPTVCPVVRLRAWWAETGGHGPVFESPKKPGVPTSRAGLVSRVAELVAKAHVEPPITLGEFPRLLLTDRRTVIARLCSPDDPQVRDRALMSTMWWMGQRAEVVERLDLGDLTFGADWQTVTIRVGRSKTDQYGVGAKVALAAQPGYVGCPIEALTAWIRRYGALLNISTSGASDLERTESVLAELAARQAPLFPALNRGAPEGRLGYDGINDIAKKYAHLAGIEPGANEGVSSHGFRAGNTTALLQQGRSSEAIAHHQLRKDSQHIHTYYRPADDIENNPTYGLASSYRHRTEAPPDTPMPAKQRDPADGAPSA